MKIQRLMGIVTLLLKRGQMTAPELAQRFEVSILTISRDIEVLCQAGIPIVTTQGYGGGIALAEGYKWDQALLTEAEAALLSASVKGLDSVLSSPTLQELREKLAPPKRETIIIDLASHYQDTLTPKLGLIKQAIEANQMMTFTYYGAQDVTKRFIEPYHLVFCWSDWYVLGYCRQRQDFRLFKLNRLWELELTPTSFTPRAVPPEALDFHQAFSQGTITFQGLFAASARSRLIEEYGVQSFTEQADGQLFFKRQFLRWDYLQKWVLSFGGQVTVLAPDDLREQVMAEAQEILRRNKEI